jgi:hypothetical protein
MVILLALSGHRVQQLKTVLPAVGHDGYQVRSVSCSGWVGWPVNWARLPLV